jgi:hypothetical protein
MKFAFSRRSRKLSEKLQLVSLRENIHANKDDRIPINVDVGTLQLVNVSMQCAQNVVTGVLATGEAKNVDEK